MKKKSVLFCLLAVLAAGLSVFLLVRSSQGSGAFRGSFVKNSDSYLLNAERMTGTDTHTLALQKGDVLQIHFAVDAHRLGLHSCVPPLNHALWLIKARIAPQGCICWPPVTLIDCPVQYDACGLA